jgi:hypothetical protein
MTDIPEISVGKGRRQISLKGKEAIREGGWTIRWLLFTRGLATIIMTIAVVLVLLGWR